MQQLFSSRKRAFPTGHDTQRITYLKRHTLAYRGQVHPNVQNEDTGNTHTEYRTATRAVAI